MWWEKSCSLCYPRLGQAILGPLPILRACWRWWGGGWLSQNVELHRVIMATCIPEVFAQVLISSFVGATTPENRTAEPGSYRESLLGSFACCLASGRIACLPRQLTREMLAITRRKPKREMKKNLMYTNDASCCSENSE